MNRTEHNVRVVWLVVNRKTGSAVAVRLGRLAARNTASWFPRRTVKVVRCVVQETKRKGGGA